jgi:hypothetical protein
METDHDRHWVHSRAVSRSFVARAARACVLIGRGKFTANGNGAAVENENHKNEKLVGTVAVRGLGIVCSGGGHLVVVTASRAHPRDSTYSRFGASWSDDVDLGYDGCFSTVPIVSC